MNICVFCLAELFPQNPAYGGSARRGLDWVRDPELNVINVVALYEEGCLIYNASGRPLPMRAVSSFAGTLVCAQHAIDAMQELKELRR